MSAPFTDLRLMGYTPPSAENPLLLGLSGKMRAGKTSLANHVVKKYGGVVTSFATTLKVEVYDALAIPGGLTEFYAWCNEAKNTLPVPPVHVLPPGDTTIGAAEKIAFVDEHKADLRPLMEYWGDWRREYAPRYFIDATLSRIEKLRLTHDVVLVDDVRTREEVLALESVGFTIVRIQSCDSCRSDRGGATTSHKTETELDAHCHEHTVFNDQEPHVAEAALTTIITKILTH